MPKSLSPAYRFMTLAEYLEATASPAEMLAGGSGAAFTGALAAALLQLAAAVGVSRAAPTRSRRLKNLRRRAAACRRRLLSLSEQDTKRYSRARSRLKGGAAAGSRDALATMNLTPREAAGVCRRLNRLAGEVEKLVGGPEVADVQVAKILAAAVVAACRRIVVSNQKTFKLRR